MSKMNEGRAGVSTRKRILALIAFVAMLGGLVWVIYQQIVELPRADQPGAWRLAAGALAGGLVGAVIVWIRWPHQIIRREGDRPLPDSMVWFLAGLALILLQFGPELLVVGLIAFFTGSLLIFVVVSVVDLRRRLSASR